MAAYSLDLCQRILSAWQNQENTQRGLAKRFKVSLSFVQDFLRRYRETNEIAAKPQGGDRRSKIKGEDEELLKKIVAEQNDIYARNTRKIATRERNRGEYIGYKSYSYAFRVRA